MAHLCFSGFKRLKIVVLDENELLEGIFHAKKLIEICRHAFHHKSEPTQHH